MTPATPPAITRVLIIDDHPIFRRGLALSLGEAEDLEICGEGASAAEALQLARDLAPDLILLDLSMPGGGLTALQKLRACRPAARVAVLTASEDSEDVMASLREGADGYILKGIGSRALIEAVRAVARGEGYVAPSLAARILAETSRDSQAARLQTEAAEESGRLLSQLTPRESEVLALVARGSSNKEVAREANMQEKTVKHHMTRILHKLKVRNRTEAAMVLRGERPGR